MLSRAIARALIVFGIMSVFVIANYNTGSAEPIQLESGMQCWGNGEKAITPYPGHVIYRYDEEWLIGGKSKADEALNNIFGKSDTGISVYKFCV